MHVAAAHGPWDGIVRQRLARAPQHRSPVRLHQIPPLGLRFALPLQRRVSIGQSDHGAVTDQDLHIGVPVVLDGDTCEVLGLLDGEGLACCIQYWLCIGTYEIFWRPETTFMECMSVLLWTACMSVMCMACRSCAWNA